MEKSLVDALSVAEKMVPDYVIEKAIDYGNYYFFACKDKNNNPRNGPAINKKTLKAQDGFCSANLVIDEIYGIYEVEDIRKNSKVSSL